MATTPSGPTLTCSQCDFVNEAERVYCHNCGAKLDRSLLPHPEEVTKESIEKARRRVKKITNPGGLNPAQEAKTFGNVLIYAVLVSLIVQLVRPPVELPPAKPEDLGGRMVSSEVTEALEAGRPVAIQFTENDLNIYLRSSLKSKATGVLPGVKFELAYVNLEPGNVYIGLQQSIAGYSLYSGVRHEVSVKDGKLVTRNQGGNFGRIAVHPLIMQYLTIAFNPLWKALKRDGDQLQKMQQIILDKDRVVLVTTGRAQ